MAMKTRWRKSSEDGQLKCDSEICCAARIEKQYAWLGIGDARIGALRTAAVYMALLVLLALMQPARAFAAASDLEAVLTGSRARIEKLDYRATGQLTRVGGDGKRTSY